jgi:membrane protein implicated in regulation of membrane protease activity
MRPADAGRPFRRIAVIIRRDVAPAAAHLRDELHGLVSLAAVIIDRRYGERRRTEATHLGERRQTDRRRRSVAQQLREGGWAVVTVEDSTSRD